MKSAYKILFAGVLAITLVPQPSYAAKLLGGLLNLGSDSGNSDKPVEVKPDAIKIGGKNGVSVNLGGLTGGGSGSNSSQAKTTTSSNPVSNLLGGGGGGGGVKLPVQLPKASIGVPGVATITTSPKSGGGSSVGVTVLGGGGSNISTNPGGLLGPGGGVSVSLPGLGSLTGGGSGGGAGGNGGAGGPGGAGGAGSGGGVGGNGGNGGYPAVAYSGGGSSGTGFDIPVGGSSRLAVLLQILADRDWLQLSNGQAVCLTAFATAEVQNSLPQKDWGKFQRALTSYSQDIYTLRQLLAACRSSAQRQALNISNLNRVIGIDIRDGTPVLLML